MHSVVVRNNSYIYNYSDDRVIEAVFTVHLYHQLIAKEMTMKLYSNFIDTGRRQFPQRPDYYVRFSLQPLSEAAEVSITQIPVTGIWVECPDEVGYRAFARVRGGQVVVERFRSHLIIETDLSGLRIWEVDPDLETEEECFGVLVK